MFQAMKKYQKMLLASVLVGLIGVTGCAGSSAGTTAQGTTAGATGSKVLKIGVVGPESGGSAQLGQGQRKAVEMAVKEINDQKLAGEWTLEAAFQDDEGNPTKSSSATNKLIQESKVHVLIGAINSSATLADMVVTQRAGIPQITAGSTGSSITEQGNPWIFRTAANDALQAEALVQYAKTELGLAKAATFTAADDYGQSGARLLKSAMEKYGMELVEAATYNNGDKDFKPQLASIKSKEAQAIFMWGLYTEAALISNQTSQLGVNAQLFGASGMASQKLIELGGSSAQGLILTQTFLPDADIALVTEFVQKYKTTYGENPIPHAAQAYDTVYILADAVKRAGKTDPEALRDAIRAVSGLKLVTGNPKFNDQGDDIGKRLLITKISGEKFELVKAIQTQ